MRLAVFTQDLGNFTANRAFHLRNRLMAELGVGLEVYALVWPDYEAPATPHPQMNRVMFREWKLLAPGVPLWAWMNARPDQGSDVHDATRLSSELQPYGFLLDIEGKWTEGANLQQLIGGIEVLGRPMRASLAGFTPSHVEYDYRTLDAFDVEVDWQSYLDSGEGTDPATAILELYRSTMVVGGWQYRMQIGGKYGWGKIGRYVGDHMEVDSYQHPGKINASLAVRPLPFGFEVRSGELVRPDGSKGLLMGRARYALTRATLDVTRGADQARSLFQWTQLAASARVQGAARRQLSVYMGESTNDDVLVAIARGMVV